ncbi:MAG: hypothetical protein JWP59_2315 [Massilia sp.]|nr:hypothetical protein [Massilia sp.]
MCAVCVAGARQPDRGVVGNAGAGRCGGALQHRAVGRAAGQPQCFYKDGIHLAPKGMQAPAAQIQAMVGGPVGAGDIDQAGAAASAPAVKVDDTANEEAR